MRIHLTPPTRTRGVIAAVLVAGAALAGASCSNYQGDAAIHETTLSSQAKTSMQRQFDSEIPEDHLVVTKVQLVRAEGNKYDGLAVVHGPRGIDHQVGIHVTEGASGTLYQLDKADMIWIYTEGAGPSADAR